MSFAPVTSHPRFEAATARFHAALPELRPTTRQPMSIPAAASLGNAIHATLAGVADLRPMTRPTTMWVHDQARTAIASAEVAIDLLEQAYVAVSTTAVDPATGSVETAAAVARARELIVRAIDASTLS